MKKYLMTGVAALAICAAFTSCSKGEELYDQGAIDQGKAETMKEAYNKAFIEYVGGPIASNQDWGFGSARTRTAQTNSNEWYLDKPTGYGLQKPADLSPEEIEYVMNWFSEEKQGHGETLDLDYYFVQQVGYGDKDNNGVTHTVSGQVWEKFEGGKHVYRTETYTVNSKEHMDWIASNMKANVQSEADCDHVNNFNTSSGSLMLMQYSETQYGFAFKDSWGTVNNLVSTNYYMVHLVADYKGKHIDGWYVGFDYQTLKTKTETKTYSVPLDHDPWYEMVTEDITTENVRLDPDGIYNDRVVKIVPASETTTPPTTRNYTLRVLGEDLTFSENATGVDKDADFDFNDVVFDVCIDTEKQETWIKLQAAGGTLPLYIDGLEVHDLFGVGPKDMVNTNWASGKKKSPVERKLDHYYANAVNIPVTVTKNGVTIPLEAPRGEPASKIAVDITTRDFKWCDERVSMKQQYPLFTDWATKTGFNSLWW